ncbi:MAG: CPBP family intramembrane glutamic endopeptidase [Pseudomonadota bacterium]
MAGTLVAILFSWLVLRLTVREPLDALGVVPTKRRISEFLVGLCFMAIVGIISFLWQAHFKDVSYEVNPDYHLGQLIGGSFWVLSAVLFEEFLFRGALLYLLIRYLGVVKACLISSVAFGVYHWFSYELFGSRLILMIYIFLVTGAGGWMFAYAYAKTRSLYAPTGLHLGWNLVTAIVFSSGPIGEQWLIQQGEGTYSSEWITLLFFTLQAIVAPGLVTWYLQKFYRAPAEPSADRLS